MERTLLRKVFCAVLIASFLASAFMIDVDVQSLSTTQLRVDPSIIEYWSPALGEAFMVNISIADVYDLVVYNFTFYWDTTLLDLVEVEVHQFLDNPWYVPINDTNEPLGRYWLYVFSTGTPKDGSGMLASLTFQITSDPTWPQNFTCALDLGETYLWNSQSNLIPHDVYDGEYWCKAFPPLAVTAMTDKQSYDVYETIHVLGDLTLGFINVQDGLVALEVDNSQDEIVAIRTLSTGIPPASQAIEITHVTPCGGPPDYPPRSWFDRGTTAYFNVTIANNGDTLLRVLVTVSPCDSNNVALGVTWANWTILGETTDWSILQFQIPGTASLGNAWVYANVLSGHWPREGGTTRCLEANATFEIRESGTAGAPTGPLQNPTSPQGMYNVNFALDQYGTYKAYVVSDYVYQGRYQKASDTATFYIGGPWDVDGNGVVNILDVLIIAVAFGTEPGDPKWDPRADVDANNIVNILDILLVAVHFGEGQ